MNKFRTHNCSELNEKNVNQKVKLSGWLHRKRDHGNLLFLDLRDHFGITQCVIENHDKNFKTLENLERIEGFDTSLAQEIIDRSKSFIQEKEESDKKLIEEKISDEKLKNLKGMNNSILAELAKSNILNVNDFADLATFELIDKEEGILKQLDIDEEIANNMIMEARSFWSEEQNKD